MAKYREITIAEMKEGDIVSFQFGTEFVKAKVRDIFPDAVNVVHLDLKSFKSHHYQHLTRFYYSDHDQLTKLQKIKRWLKSLCA